MRPMYINGQWVEASDGASFEVYDPATGEVIDNVASRDRLRPLPTTGILTIRSRISGIRID
jgi:hypothetical protein